MAEPTRVPTLAELGRTPLGETRLADVEAMTARVLATHQDLTRIPAAKFSSII